MNSNPIAASQNQPSQAADGAAPGSGASSPAGASRSRPERLELGRLLPALDALRQGQRRTLRVGQATVVLACTRGLAWAEVRWPNGRSGRINRFCSNFETEVMLAVHPPCQCRDSDHFVGHRVTTGYYMRGYGTTFGSIVDVVHVGDDNRANVVTVRWDSGIVAVEHVNDLTILRD